eukprot:c7568_g1_i2.p2 GENE.c7568_g1_i2~~c7568_g1_i2.p2  ORF type:complete len:106 (+),score=27.58 c7568_g1_i2:240-557(+)
MKLRHAKFKTDLQPVDPECDCHCCRTFSRAYLHALCSADSAVAYQLLTLHNVTYEMNLMGHIRDAINAEALPEFVGKFMLRYYPAKDYPAWVVDALRAVDITLPQ